MPKKAQQKACGSVWILFILLKWLPFTFRFILGNKAESHGAKSGECGGCGMTTILFSIKNCIIQREKWMGSLHDAVDSHSCATVTVIFIEDHLSSTSKHHRKKSKIHWTVKRKKFSVKNALDFNKQTKNEHEFFFHSGPVMPSFGLGDCRLFQCDDCCFVPGS